MPTAELLGYVAFNAPSPGIFAGQSSGNPQVKQDPRELSWLSPPAVFRWTTGYRTYPPSVAKMIRRRVSTVAAPRFV